MFGFGKKPSSSPPAPAVEPSAAVEAAPVEPVSAPVAARGPTPDEALSILREGNAAFLRGEVSGGAAAELAALEAGQSPIAVMIGCSDSRTSPTLLFGQGFGRLFQIRVAGNTVDARGLSSIVYAVKHLKAPLVVVLGHSGCGAVAAAGAVIDGGPPDPSLEAMLTPILPAVIAARASGQDPVQANARRTAQLVASADPTLADAVASGSLKVVPAVMALGTGKVTFLN